MKILILVGGSMIPPYDAFMSVQKETWAAIPCDGVETMFFYSADKTEQISEDTFSVKCDDGYYWAQWKMKQALDYVWDMDWDIIFRCHSSSYVDKGMLKQLCRVFPTQRLYTGQPIGGENLPLIDWGGKKVKQICVSGAGIFMSRDVADILRHELREESSIEEDVLYGRMLQWHGLRINDLNVRRVDIESMEDYTRNFHYRFRTGDREQDMQNMRLVHEKHIAL